MAFEDGFADCMSGGNIQIDPTYVPDADTLAGVIDYLKQWLQGFDQDIRDGLDDVTAANPVSIALMDSELNAVDSSYAGLLEAFDAASGVPLSTCIEWCEYCIEQARAAES